MAEEQHKLVRLKAVVRPGVAANPAAAGVAAPTPAAPAVPEAPPSPVAPPASVAPAPITPPPAAAPQKPAALAAEKTTRLAVDGQAPTIAAAGKTMHLAMAGESPAGSPVASGDQAQVSSSPAAFATTRIGAASLNECACPRCGRYYNPPPDKPLQMFTCLGCQKPFLIPGRIPGFNLVERIGSGEMGEIYRAKDETLGRDVAVKIIRAQYASDDTSRERLRQEARAAARLSHPRVAQIFALGFSNGQPYVVMELVQGEDMLAILEREGRVGEHTALRAALDVADGLASMHAAGMVHGDIKPGNIVLDRNGNAKLVDFGLAGMTRKDASGGIVGTPHYIAPELLRGASDSSRSDIYSLGATLYHVLTGQPPFDGATPLDVAKARLTQSVVPIGARAPGISRPTQRIVMRMLERDPASRYPDCTGLSHDLRLAIKNFDAPSVIPDAPATMTTLPAQPDVSPTPAAPYIAPSTSTLPIHPVLSGSIQMAETLDTHEEWSRRRVILWTIMCVLFCVVVWRYVATKIFAHATSGMVQTSLGTNTLAGATPAGMTNPAPVKTVPAVSPQPPPVPAKAPPPAVVHTPMPASHPPVLSSSVWSFFSRFGSNTLAIMNGTTETTAHEEKPAPPAAAPPLLPANPAFARPLTPAWLNGDLDEASIRGSTIWLSGSTVVMQGDGFDVLNISNKCRFVHTLVSSAYAFSARVVEIGCTHALAKTGIMTRSDNPDAGPNIFFGFLGDGALTMQARLPTGNEEVNILTLSPSNEWHACYLRLERKGNDFRTFTSTNGRDWVPFAVYNINMPDESRVGLVVTSHKLKAFATGKFDKIHLWGLVPAASGDDADASGRTNSHAAAGG